MNDLKPVALIPAYKPEPAVVEIALELVQSRRFHKVVVVNDGSGPEFETTFEALGEIKDVELLTHYVNLGKGAALKSGLNHVACRYPESVGIVTLDADGQHLAEDVFKVAAKLFDNPHNLILGSREFKSDVPLRSRFGNLMTRGVMRVVGGLCLRDTQTGLRGIPMEFLTSLLKLKTIGYDFELDMLLKSKEQGLDVIEVPIHTVYIDENKSTHFNPFLDSLKIYLVFLRFNLSSLLSVVIDYSVFTFIFATVGNVFESQIGGRFCAGIVNYYINRSFVFKSNRKHQTAMAMYFLTLMFMTIVSYGLIQLMHAKLETNIYISKVLSESILYVVSFALQRDFIFTLREKV